MVRHLAGSDRKHFVSHCVLAAALGAAIAFSGTGSIMTFCAVFCLWCVLQTSTTGGWVPLVFLAGVLMSGIAVVTGTSADNPFTPASLAVGGAVIVIGGVLAWKMPVRKSYEILPDYLHKGNKELKKFTYGGGKPVHVLEFMEHYDNNMYDNKFQREITGKLLEYYIQEDLGTFRLLKHTAGLLKHFFPILDKIEREELHTGRGVTTKEGISVSYVAQVVDSCTVTVRNLLFRALTEGREARRHDKIHKIIHDQENKDPLPDRAAVAPVVAPAGDGGVVSAQHKARRSLMAKITAATTLTKRNLLDPGRSSRSGFEGEDEQPEDNQQQQQA